MYYAFMPVDLLENNSQKTTSVFALKNTLHTTTTTAFLCK